MLFHICLCVLLLFCVQAVPLRLSIAPSSGNIELGETKDFICKVVIGEPEAFLWYNPDGEEIEEDQDDRFVLDISEYSATLQIKGAQTSDNGIYKCVVDLDDGEQLVRTVMVDVIQAPKVQNVVPEQAFNEGTDAVLRCDVIGIPMPAVTWTRDGQKALLRGDGRITKLFNHDLQIRNIQVSDAGTYDCVAELSSRKQEDRASTTVTVNYAPKLIAADPEPLYTWLRNPVNVSCPILSLPQANITWARGDMNLQEVFDIFTVGAAPELTSTLEVTVNSQADFAAYTCTARNELGEVTRTVLIKEAGTPTAPWNVTVDPHSTTVRVLVGKPTNDGGIPVLGYRLQWRETKATEWTSKIMESDTFQVSELEPYTLYHFRAAAFNGKGLGNYSAPVSARTLSIREPDSPKVVAKNESEGNSFRIYFDDLETGGSPVLRHNIKYKEEQAKQWINDTVNGTNSYLLQDLKWSTEYLVEVVAQNRINLSRPTFFNFSTPQEPLSPAAEAAVGDKAKVGTGGIIGIIMLIFLVLLVAVDVTCYYTNKCGILMCITTNVLGRKDPEAKCLEQDTGVTAMRSVSVRDKDAPGTWNSNYP